jgi:FkbM family methyltransferase
MTRILSLIIYKILKFFDKGFNFLTKRSFLIWMKSFLESDSYKKVNIAGVELIFFTPNQLTEWRVSTYLSKEPETLEWIDSFEKKENLIFWDIGANIGLYSIYNAIKNKNSKTYSFEPSTSNLRVLTRNISNNNLEKEIFLFPFPLTNKSNLFMQMNEGEFVEGGALNTFGEDYDFEGKKFYPKMKYTTFGTSIDYILKNKILEIPDYIKIDVDGIEHMILAGAKSYLKNLKIKSVLVEINENFKDQHEQVLKIMGMNDFKILCKKQNAEILSKNSKFNNTFNYFFSR